MNNQQSLVERLRGLCDYDYVGDIAKEAAARIEALEAQLSTNAGLQELTDIAQSNSLWNAESVKENAERLQRAVAVFDGYIDDMPVIKWLGEAVPAGTEFYAQVKETGIPLTHSDAHVKPAPALTDALRSLCRSTTHRLMHHYKLNNGDLLYREMIDVAQAAILQAAQPVADKWHEAVLQQCMAVESCYVADDPTATLNNLINWHVLNERDSAAHTTGEQKK